MATAVINTWRPLSTPSVSKKLQLCLLSLLLPSSSSSSLCVSCFSLYPPGLEWSCPGVCLWDYSFAIVVLLCFHSTLLTHWSHTCCRIAAFLLRLYFLWPVHSYSNPATETLTETSEVLSLLQLLSLGLGYFCWDLTHNKGVYTCVWRWDREQGISMSPAYFLPPWVYFLFIWTPPRNVLTWLEASCLSLCF